MVLTVTLHNMQQRTTYTVSEATAPNLVHRQNDFAPNVVATLKGHQEPLLVVSWSGLVMWSGTTPWYLHGSLAAMATGRTGLQTWRSGLVIRCRICSLSPKTGVSGGSCQVLSLFVCSSSPSPSPTTGTSACQRSSYTTYHGRLH